MRILMRFRVQNAPDLTLHRYVSADHHADCKENDQLLVEGTPPSNLCYLGGVLGHCYTTKIPFVVG